MKTRKSVFFGAILILAVCFISCDDDDVSDDPAGTVTLNMLNDENGRTLLGNSDVYIDNANNFYGSSCSIAYLGKKQGLGYISEPVLHSLETRVAMEVGSAYQVFRNAAVSVFPSGKLALDIDADYYNVYVVSQIERDGVFVGANVKYALMSVPKNGLPEYNSYIGALKHLEPAEQEITLTLPTSDFEVETQFASSNYYTLGYKIEGNRLKVKLEDYRQSDIFGFYIRIKGSYTYVYGEVV